jgi:hypothetical protein
MPSKNQGKTAGGKFAPGNRFGKGRPQGSRNKASLAVETLLDGEAEVLTRKAVEMALSGDATALRLCMERIAPARKDAPVRFFPPEITEAGHAVKAMGAVLQAVAEGDMTPVEAKAVSGVIETWRRTVETSDLEDRIARLESGGPGQ